MKFVVVYLFAFTFYLSAFSVCDQTVEQITELNGLSKIVSRGSWELKFAKHGTLYLVSEKDETHQTLLNFFGGETVAKQYLHPRYLSRNRFLKGEAILFKKNNFSMEIAAGNKDPNTFWTLEDLSYADPKLKYGSGNYNCMFSSLQMINGKIPNEVYSLNKQSKKSSDVYLEDFKKDLEKNYKNISLNEAEFGKTLITFGFNHVAVYLGQNDKGDIFVMTKNGYLIKPQIMNIKDFVQGDGDFVDYNYGKPRNVTLDSNKDDKLNKNFKQGTGIYIKR